MAQRAAMSLAGDAGNDPGFQRIRKAATPTEPPLLVAQCSSD
jgi:hypothetical protein